MTIDGKRQALDTFCKERRGCKDCPHNAYENCDFNTLPVEDIERAYKLVFGDKPQKDENLNGSCYWCKFEKCDENDFPCNDCTHNNCEGTNHFESINNEQNVQCEVINHSDEPIMSKSGNGKMTLYELYQNLMTLCDRGYGELDVKVVHKGENPLMNRGTNIYGVFVISNSTNPEINGIYIEKE